MRRVACDILDTFCINTTSGSKITYIPTYKKWVNIKSGILKGKVVVAIYLKSKTKPHGFRMLFALLAAFLASLFHLYILAQFP